MSEEAKPKFDLPWGTLLPVLAALAGVVAQFKPLVSTRPAAPAEKPVPVIALQDVDARLWQDPIAVAQKQKSALFAEMGAGVVPKDRGQLHDISTLVQLLHDRVASNPDHVLLLGVMIDAGPYSEQGELRLRTRQAVLEGLSESGFVPRDGEHIGYVTSPWPLPSKFLDNIAASVENSGLLLPWEECEMDNREHVFPAHASSVIVLWLPSTSFSPDPLTRFGGLIATLTNNIRDQVDVKLLGPPNSTGLQNMVREVRSADWTAWKGGREKELHGNSAVPQNAAQSTPSADLNDDSKRRSRDALDGVSIFSARATAADAMLLYDAASQVDAPARPPPKSVQDLLENAVPPGPGKGLRFRRTIATDDVVLAQLIAELKLRRVPIETVGPNRDLPPNAPHVVLLSEWDTPYGRSLGTTFASEAYHQPIKEIILRRARGLIKPEEQRLRRIHTYRYMRGIDGLLPGDPARGTSPEQAHKSSSGPDAVAIESTEGLNQADYLRRLARVLKENDAEWRAKDRVGIGAIGLLGADIYDKLMILRALRPEFPNAIFFTNTYDAHFERPDDLDDTHNLIIGSPFGNQLPTNFRTQRVAPFRDSNQTSIYAGTLAATGRMDEMVAAYFSWQPRIFEISRHGAYDLSEPWYLEGKEITRTNKTWIREWLHSDNVRWHLVIAGLALVLIVAWVSASNAHRSLPGGGTTPQRIARVFLSTPFWVICGTLVIVLSVSAYAQTDGANLEPLAFFSGISVWPSEMLRLVALMLALHFMIKAGIDMRANAREIEKRYCLNPLPPTPFRWSDIGLGFELWTTKKTQRPAPDAPFAAQAAWDAYSRRNKFWPRFARVGILFVLYLVFSLFLFLLFPSPVTPARGEVAFRFDRLVLIPAGLGLMVLTFYVVDAIQLNSNFIRLFAREVTRWGHGVAEQCRRCPPLNEEELSAYHEIFFVAQRTQVIARLIWYPLIVLALMVVARWSFFDNWPWPAGLVIIFALDAGWALGSAVYLRRAAEQLRAAALDNLALLRLGAFTDEVKRETFEELIEEIRGLKKGAFAPLGEQPFIRAVLLPSGGLGLLAVAQRLLDLF